MLIGNIILDYKKGVTMNSLAASTGLSRFGIRKIIKRHNGKMESIVKIAKALDITTPLNEIDIMA